MSLKSNKQSSKTCNAFPLCTVHLCLRKCEHAVKKFNQFFALNYFCVMLQQKNAAYSEVLSIIMSHSEKHRHKNNTVRYEEINVVVNNWNITESEISQVWPRWDKQSKSFGYFFLLIYTTWHFENFWSTLWQLCSCFTLKLPELIIWTNISTDM